jgi:non-specific serine/threonine protein kinase
VQWGIAICLEGLARVAAHQGRLEQAARWWGAAASLRDAIGAPLSEDDRLAYDYDRSIDDARTRLGAMRFAEAWAEGQATSTERVIAEALDAGDPATVRH